jgi:hypothetical protein
MALDATELFIPGTGHVYSAAEGTAMPTDVTTPGTGWSEHGYTTEDGVTLTFGISTDDIKGWQSFDPLRTIVTEKPKTVKFDLMQNNAMNLLIALGGGTFDSTSGLYTPAPPEYQDIRAILVVAIDGTETIAFYAPRMTLSENVEIPWHKSGAAELPLTFKVMAADPTYNLLVPQSWDFPTTDTLSETRGSDETDKAA